MTPDSRTRTYFEALVRVFKNGLRRPKPSYPKATRDARSMGLDRVRVIGRNVGYSVGGDVNSLLARHRSA